MYTRIKMCNEDRERYAKLYRDDQPRDDDGKWTDTGQGGKTKGKVSDKAKSAIQRMHEKLRQPGDVSVGSPGKESHKVGGYTVEITERDDGFHAVVVPPADASSDEEIIERGPYKTKENALKVGESLASPNEATTEELEQADRDHAETTKPAPITNKDGTISINHTEYPKWLKERSFAELQYIARDAAETAKLQPDNPKNGYYLDEVNYALDEMYRRERE